MQRELSAIAEKHSSNMARRRVPFGHSGFDKRSRQAQSALQGVHAFAENVAFGQHSGKEVVDGWMRSAGHRQNILGNYRYIGIGVARNAKGILYYTQVFAN